MEGLIISLRRAKIKPCTNEEIFHVLGYYSAMSYKKVKTLKEFAPNTVNDEYLGDNSDLEKFDNFHIRLILDDELGISNFKNYFGDCLGNNSSKLLENKPLMSLILLHFSKDTWADYSCLEIKEKIKNKIEYVIKNITDNGNDLNAVFSINMGLGSVDAIVFCRSDNFYIAGELLNELRREEKFVSSAYWIPCILQNENNEKIKKWQESKFDEKTQLSIRVTLKPSISEEEFIAQFIKDIIDKKIEKNKEKNKEDVIKNVSFNKISGSYDLLILTNVQASNYIEMFTEESVLTKLDDKNKFVLNVRTTVRIFKDGNKIIESNENIDTYKDNEDEKRIKKDIERAIERAYKCMKWHIDNMHGSPRIMTAIMKSLNTYFKITKLSHNFDIRQMLNNVLLNFIRLMEFDQKVYENNQYISDKQISDKQESDKQEKMKLRSEDINYFRLRFISMVNDFARSSRQWIEGQALLHEAMGNSKKLIINYYIFVSDVSKIFEPDNYKRYPFFITSGGTDEIEAKEFFPHFNKENRLPVITEISIPEKSIYNVSQTLFDVCHEIFHFIGDRKRDVRKTNFIKSIVIYIVNEMTYAILDKMEDYDKEKCSYVKKIRSKKGSLDKAIVKKCIEKISISDEIIYLKDLERELEKQLKYIVMNPFDEIKTENLIKKEENIDSPEKIFIRSSFCKDVSLAIYNFCVKVIIPKYNDGEIDYSKELKNPTHEENRLKHYINKLVIYYLSYISGKVDTNYFGNRKKIHNVVEDFRDAYEETFSDLCGAILLKHDLKSYMELFYNRIKDILPNNESAIFRLFSVLATIINGQEADVSNKLQELNNRGIISSELLKKIEAYRLIKNSLTPLEAYLRECKTSLEKIIDANEELVSDLKRFCVKEDSEKLEYYLSRYEKLAKKELDDF